MAKIVVVDDTDAILDVFLVLLTFHGYTVASCTSKTELTHILPTANADLVILDVRLGGLDGRSICKEIKQNELTKHIPIILISGSPELLTNYEECGAAAIIEKPFAIENVLQVIKDALYQ